MDTNRKNKPGDKEHSIEKTVKVTSGSTDEIAKRIDSLYSSVVDAGTHMAESIKVAEAAKVNENAKRYQYCFCQRVSKIFNLIQVDTTDISKDSPTNGTS